MNWLSKLLCLFGWHGPNVLGNESQYRSCRTEPFVRVCQVCGAEWAGREVETRYERTLGGWRKKT